ncbi:MAG: YeaH/YhbH family protein [Thaumarchaeota archaeon]|nr:YeaH/YhbH family protein [Nitrososphaerota archaeon]
MIDRRQNDKKKSSTNRARYVRRVREQVKEAVKDIIRDGSITDNLSNKSKKIRINKKGLNQPEFQHDVTGGIRDRVLPGNKKYQQGDRIDKPPSDEGGGGKKGSPDGEGEDDFEFALSREEFLDLFFEDLELPDMIKKDMVSVTEFVMKRAGFTTTGNPSRLNILRSMRQAISRRVALQPPKRKEIEKLEKALAEMKAIVPHDDADAMNLAAGIENLELEIKRLKRRKKAIPFIDDIDLRYNRWEKVPVPTTQAVMFGIMDVSGSMGEWEKEMAKRFFMLMLLFLQHNYERVDIVWIRHHSVPKEVDEEEFFYSTESGGTVVSSALELMAQIVKNRYPLNQWNVFGTQISDGDNFSHDCPVARDVMEHQILPISQYFAYVEVDRNGNRSKSDLWPHYEALTNHKHFVMSKVNDVSDIFPVFRALFEKKGSTK